MCNQNRCSAWISLHALGIPYEGCLKDPSWIKLPPSSHVGHKYIYLPNQKLSCIDRVAQGQFGNIDLALYEYGNEKKEIYVKRPILSESLLYEACIQHLVSQSFSSVGFSLGAPPVVCIFSLKNGSVCFGMEQIAGACTLNHYLNNVKGHDITTVIVECLLQLCAMTWHLHGLGINHRDLKPSNFLIVEHAPIVKRLIIDHEVIEVMICHSLTMIDFGFACLGSDDKTHLSLSSVYSRTDKCPKEGRDLFLFLGLLYLDYHKKLPPTLCRLFETWIDPNLCAFMRKDSVYSMQWLYFMAGNESIVKFQSHPLRILQDLRAL